MRRLQFVWWGWDGAYWGFGRPDASRAASRMFSWFLWLGPLEVRCWRSGVRPRANFRRAS